VPLVSGAAGDGIGVDDVSGASDGVLPRPGGRGIDVCVESWAVGRAVVSGEAGSVADVSRGARSGTGTEGSPGDGASAAAVVSAAALGA
jgi:hypothetical protein